MAEKTEVLGQVKLIDVRASFCHVHKKSPDKVNSKTKEIIKGSYQLNALMDPNTDIGKANLAKLKAARLQLMEKKWGTDQKKWPKIKPEKLCVRDGSLENYDGYEGMYYCSMRSDDKPVTIDRIRDANGKWVELDENSGKIYSGCYVNIIARVWIQDNEHGIRVNCEVKSVQFLRHGAAFGNAAPIDPNEEFGDDDVGPDDLDDFSGEGQDPELDDDASSLV